MTDKAPTAGEAPKLVSFTVDGRTLQAEEGRNLLEALLDAGEPISYFCYHPGLSVAACCRQCLVANGPPPARLTPACQMRVTEGLSIVTESDQVRDARAQMLEFTLLNHPVDCVICDKAGECALQRQYMEWDRRESMVSHEKVHKRKRVDLGPTIVLDAERCILCSRCIRFCDEVAKSPQLTFERRGDHEELTVAPGHQLDNPYSLNTVDICPVGALTDKDFRFQIRVWELYATRSVCNGCATGCPMEIHHKGGRVYRLTPPKRHDMNLNWMCDEGRRTYKALGDARVAHPRVDGERAELGQALGRAAQRLADAHASAPERVALVVGADVTNEDAFVAASFALDRLEGARLFLADLPDDGRGDDILRRDDPNPNRAGAAACTRGKAGRTADLEAALAAGEIDALHVVGGALQLSAEGLERAAALPLLSVQAARVTPLVERAQVVLPAAMWAEVDGTLTNAEGKVQRLRPAVEPPGEARPHRDLLARLAATMGIELGLEGFHAIFDVMRQAVPAFAGANPGPELPTVQLRFAGSRG